jgi:hypothetical protein
MKQKHAAVLHAIAEGETVQYKGGDDLWRIPERLDKHNPLTCPDWEWRIKPKTFTLNGEEMPMPSKGGKHTMSLGSNAFGFSTIGDREKVYDALMKALTP